MQCEERTPDDQGLTMMIDNQIDIFEKPNIQLETCKFFLWRIAKYRKLVMQPVVYYMHIYMYIFMLCSSPVHNTPDAKETLKCDLL